MVRGRLTKSVKRDNRCHLDRTLRSDAFLYPHPLQLMMTLRYPTYSCTDFPSICADASLRYNYIHLRATIVLSDKAWNVRLASIKYSAVYIMIFQQHPCLYRGNLRAPLTKTLGCIESARLYHSLGGKAIIFNLAIQVPA